MQNSPQGTATQVKPISWYVGIPICSNPLIALDILTLSVTLWLGGMLFVILGQVTIGEGLTRGALYAAFFIGMYLCGAIWAAYLFVGGFLFSNRYAALYKITEDKGVYCEYMRGRIRGIAKPLIPLAGFAINPLNDPSRSIVKIFPWGDIKTVQVLKRMRVIIIKGKRGTLTKIYCPDVPTLAKAEETILSRVKA